MVTASTVSMKSFKEFLDSSTIHGLQYISTTRNIVRLFWIFVVLTCLTTSFWLINQSFKSWAETPVITAIDSQSTSKIRLPKVTVCPPQNTYTDLNLDLIKTYNVTLNKAEKDELTRFAMEVIQNNIHMEIMRHIRKLEEKDQFNNWYQGLTQIKLPVKSNDEAYKFEIWTYKSAGEVSTQFFGLPYNESLVDRDIYIIVYIGLAPELRSNENVTLHFNLLHNLMTELKDGYDDVYVNRRIRLKEPKTIYKSFKPPGKKNCLSLSLLQNLQCGNSFDSSQNIGLKRKISKEDFANVRLKLMPGFKFSWNFTGQYEKLENSALFLTDSKTLQFIKFTNILLKTSENYSSIWSQIIFVKADFILKNLKFTCTQGFLHSSLIQENLQKIEDIFGVKNISTQPDKNVSRDYLAEAASMFLYLNSCPNSQLEWIYFYKDLIHNNSLDLIILTLNRLKKVEARDGQIHVITFASTIFEFITRKFSLDYPKMKFYREMKEPNAPKSEDYSLENSSLTFRFGSVNHPAHIFDTKEKMSPSAFIPFCELGGNVSSLSVKIAEFNVPVCSSFVPQIFRDKICYQIDLDQYRDNKNIKSQLKKGLVFILDHNEDRQIFDYHKDSNSDVSGLFDGIDQTKGNADSLIFLTTIGTGTEINSSNK